MCQLHLKKRARNCQTRLALVIVVGCTSDAAETDAFSAMVRKECEQGAIRGRKRKLKTGIDNVHQVSALPFYRRSSARLTCATCQNEVHVS